MSWLDKYAAACRAVRSGNLIYVVRVPRGSLVLPGTAGSLFLGSPWLQVLHQLVNSTNSPQTHVLGGQISEQSTGQPPRKDGTVEHPQCKAGPNKTLGASRRPPRGRAVVLQNKMQFTLGCEPIIQVTISTIPYYTIPPSHCRCHPRPDLPHSETKYPGPSSRAHFPTTPRPPHTIKFGPVPPGADPRRPGPCPVPMLPCASRRDLPFSRRRSLKKIRKHVGGRCWCDASLFVALLVVVSLDVGNSPLHLLLPLPTLNTLYLLVLETSLLV